MTEARDPLQRAIATLAKGDRLGESLTAEAFGQLMRGEATPAQAAALLMGLRVQGETADEVVGAVRAIREAMLGVTVAPTRTHLVDSCGTGGGTVPTFNISTVAAFVASGAGATVAKHGNRSYTTKCGSADVLEALGVPLALDQTAAARVLERAGIAFLFAPAFHPAMRHVGPVRRELAIGTIMNIVGPLANPARVTRQVVGVADASRGPVLAEALRRLGAEHVMVVHGRVGMDEIAPVGTTAVWEARDGEVRAWELAAADYSAEEPNLAALAGGEPAENAERLRRLLAEPGKDTAGAAAVTLNAGAVLYVSGRAADLAAGVAMARAALHEGAGGAALDRLLAAVSTSE